MQGDPAHSHNGEDTHASILMLHTMQCDATACSATARHAVPLHDMQRHCNDCSCLMSIAAYRLSNKRQLMSNRWVQKYAGGNCSTST